MIDISGAEVTSLIAHSLEAGNLQVRNDMIAQGQLQVTGGLNVGAGGIFSDGDVGVAGHVTITGTVAIANDVVPTSSPANLVQLYAEDVGGFSELMVRDEAGNITTLGPLNFSLIGQPSEPLAWSFYSENDLGKINVDMLRAMRLLESLSGERLVHIESNGTAGLEAIDNAAIDGESASLRDEASASVPLLVTYIEALQAQNRTLERRLAALERRLN